MPHGNRLSLIPWIGFSETSRSSWKPFGNFTLWLWLTVRHGISMALIEIDGLPVYLLIAWWIFPWRTVSHNQMVEFFLMIFGPPLEELWGSCGASREGSLAILGAATRGSEKLSWRSSKRSSSVGGFQKYGSPKSYQIIHYFSTILVLKPYWSPSWTPPVAT